MKSLSKLSGIAAVIAAIALFSVASCKDPTKPDVTFQPGVAFTVTFNANGGDGTPPSERTVQAGSSIILPNGSGLSRSGQTYTFGGWNTDPSGMGTNYSAGSSYTVTGDITLYAEWVEFGSGGTHEEVTIAMWDSVGDGWDDYAALRINVNGTDHVYARLDSGGGPGYDMFIVNAGDVVQIYWVSGGQYDSEIAFAVYYSDDPPNPAFDPSTGTSDTDRVLVSKWYNNPSGAVGNGTLMGSFVVGGTTTYYTVTFDVNGGDSTTPSQQRVRDGSDVTLPGGNGFSKTGYLFNGWNTDPYGTGTNYDAGSFYTVTEDVTLYANWIIAYTVSFDANGGSGTAPSAQTVQAGSSITLPNRGNLSMSATFAGWNTNADGTGTNYTADSSFTPDGDVTLYAKWLCTVTFNINGGSGTIPSAQSVSVGSSIILPSGSDLSKNFCTFGVWNTNAGGTGNDYTADSSFTPTRNITLYAKWNIVPFASVTGFEEKLKWLEIYAQSNTSYSLDVNADESISPKTFSYSNGNNITITLRGVSANRTISLSSNGAMFTVGSGVSLVLDNNITLQGRSANTSPLVRVNDGGTLRMSYGSTISGNTASFSNNGTGGGVFVSGRGTFNMNGGTISGNTTSGSGGGVYVAGTFNMSGGIISGNTASNAHSSYTAGPGGGGGVYVTGGTFNKTGGTIYGYNYDDTVNSNVVKNNNNYPASDSGDAVLAFVHGSVTGQYLYIKTKNTTASGNLFCNGTTFSGGWD